MDNLLTTLHLADETPITMTSLDVLSWGRHLTFTCEARPLEADPVPFSLTLKDCRDMRWQIYTHQQADERLTMPPTLLVSYRLGRDQHRSPAHILTEHFALSVFYGELIIQQGR
ncbi:hypothetical protein G4Y79_05775 [Phototrophicus methaneseepsis]|uniref:Uncharacterized protein n=1 Tax=Phototrophicus methaneseepsis TaxID=2710758 RepID=A0A7S8EBF2_9CHLR|nr:hypothetical protein [Phototrophicus methaneseepsis]QPC83887.1 hypothetical protein G4Y79_05775 [Phototrophicus methaneseepsis]